MGQRLTEFCQENTLVIVNTLFQQHKRRLYTWTSPEGQHWNQIDYIGASLVAQRLKHLSPMWETWVWSLGRDDPLEKKLVTHSSILDFRIPWTEKHGRLQSNGLAESDTTKWLHYTILFFVGKDGEILYSQQKQDQELTVTQIMNFLLPNSELKWRKWGKPLEHLRMTWIKSLMIIQWKYRK